MSLLSTVVFLFVWHDMNMMMLIIHNMPFFLESFKMKIASLCSIVNMSNITMKAIKISFIHPLSYQFVVIVRRRLLLTGFTIHVMSCEKKIRRESTNVMYLRWDEIHKLVDNDVLYRDEVMTCIVQL